jgi:hypothetical protein
MCLGRSTNRIIIVNRKTGPFDSSRIVDQSLTTIQIFQLLAFL